MSKIFQCPAGLSGEFTILDSITTIGESACTCCPLLTSIDIPDNVTSIGEHAFWSCSSLTDVIIRNSECNFDNRDDIFPDTTTIHGYNNSTAQEYAEQHNMNFVSLDDVPITTTTTTTESTTSTTTSTTTTTITEKIIGHIASDEELCNWAINDYQIKTCITAANVEINENS
ncbi:MAG: leucine-rich repeat domain-containing protein [Ruminococcus sp.]|nr:leucine-rich repeat domain-containing protein [Ruminococcus sp.]